MKKRHQDLHKVENAIDSFCEAVRSSCNPLYMHIEENENRIVERCHFDRCGTELVPTVYWYKLQKNGKLTGRKKAIASNAFIEQYEIYKHTEKQNIDDLALIPNSRIAIGPNATVYGYFCNRNLIAMDRILGILHSYQNSYCYDILELLVSYAKTTLIVGRNNTAKTSCSNCINTVLQGSDFSYNDYPLSKREGLHNLFLQFMEKKLSYEDLCKKIETISIEFVIDYSLDDPDVELGALSPFIIDVDVDTTTALIHAEYQLKTDETKLWELFKVSCYSEGKFAPKTEEMHDVLVSNFTRMFGLTIYAVNPKNLEDRQVKSHRELEDLFPYYPIPAERILGEDGTQKNESLSSLIADYCFSLCQCQ